jgi:hypothetical protein
MKAATGELNLTVITIVAVAAIIAFFWVMWPGIKRTINGQWGNLTEEANNPGYVVR